MTRKQQVRAWIMDGGGDDQCPWWNGIVEEKECQSQLCQEIFPELDMSIESPSCPSCPCFELGLHDVRVRAQLFVDGELD